MRKLRLEIQSLRNELKIARKGADTQNLFGTSPPKGLLTEYGLDAMVGLKLSRSIQKKYLSRASNINRSWNRVQLYAPELLSKSTSFDRLEMSTAHGAFLEVLRHYGHNVLGNDYVNMVNNKEGVENRAFFRGVNDAKCTRILDDYGIPVPKNGEELVDWPYRDIIDSINIPMALFDGGKIPYPLEDKSFDYVFCFQAIEHYCHPRDWSKVVGEFCRVARKSIVIMLNPIIPSLAKDEEYQSAYHEFRRQMRDFSQSDFQCTSCYVHWGEALAFKLTAG